MAQKDDNKNLMLIVNEIEKAGYNPYDQLSGYLITGNDVYITRKGGSRELIKNIDKQMIRAYLNKMGIKL